MLCLDPRATDTDHRTTAELLTMTSQKAAVDHRDSTKIFGPIIIIVESMTVWQMSRDLIKRGMTKQGLAFFGATF